MHDRIYMYMCLWVGRLVRRCMQCNVVSLGGVRRSAEVRSVRSEVLYLSSRVTRCV